MFKNEKILFLLREENKTKKKQQTSYISNREKNRMNSFSEIVFKSFVRNNPINTRIFRLSSDRMTNAYFIILIGISPPLISNASCQFLNYFFLSGIIILHHRTKILKFFNRSDNTNFLLQIFRICNFELFNIIISNLLLFLSFNVPCTAALATRMNKV